MDKKSINILDGSKEQREKIMKDFFGLKPEQSFQEIKVDEEELSSPDSQNKDDEKGEDTKKSEES